VQGTKLQAVQGKKLEPVQAEKLDNPATYYCLECLQRWEKREGGSSNGLVSGVVSGVVSIASAQEHRGEEAASGPVANTAATPAERVDWAEKCLLKFENVAEIAKEMQLVLGRLGLSCFSAASSSCTTTTLAGRAAVCDASDGAAAGQTAEADFLAQLDALEGCMELDACIQLGLTPSMLHVAVRALRAAAHAAVVLGDFASALRFNAYALHVESCLSPQSPVPACGHGGGETEAAPSHPPRMLVARVKVDTGRDGEGANIEEARRLKRNSLSCVLAGMEAEEEVDQEMTAGRHEGRDQDKHDHVHQDDLVHQDHVLLACPAVAKRALEPREMRADRDVVMVIGEEEDMVMDHDEHMQRTAPEGGASGSTPAQQPSWNVTEPCVTIGANAANAANADARPTKKTRRAELEEGLHTGDRQSGTSSGAFIKTVMCKDNTNGKYLDRRNVAHSSQEPGKLDGPQELRKLDQTIANSVAGPKCPASEQMLHNLHTPHRPALQSALPSARDRPTAAGAEGAGAGSGAGAGGGRTWASGQQGWRRSDLTVCGRAPGGGASGGDQGEGSRTGAAHPQRDRERQSTHSGACAGATPCSAVVEPGTVVWEGQLAFEMLRPCEQMRGMGLAIKYLPSDRKHHQQGRRGPQPIYRAPLRARARAQLCSGPGYEALSSWPQVVRISDMPEAQAQEALKERPKSSKITLVALTARDAGDAGDAGDAANFAILRQTLQEGKKAARVAVPHAAGGGARAGGVAGLGSPMEPPPAFAYIFAWKDAALAKKKMPPQALVCFIISSPDTPTSGSATCKPCTPRSMPLCSMPRSMPLFLSLAASSKTCTPRAMLSPSYAPGLAAGRGGAKEGGRDGDPASLKSLEPRPPPPFAPPPLHQQGLKGGVRGVGMVGSSNRGRERDMYRSRELDREREEERERERPKGRESSSRERGRNRESGGLRGGDAGGYLRDEKGPNDGGRDAHGRHRDYYGDRRGTGKSPKRKSVSETLISTSR
jgi:hypothetical protein